MFGKQCNLERLIEECYSKKITMVIVLFCLSGCAAYAGLYSFSIGNDGEGKPDESATAEARQKSIYIYPLTFGKNCSATCIQKADGGGGCIRHSQEAASDCGKYTGGTK